MNAAPLPPDEEKRLDALNRYRVLDTPDEEDFDDFTILAAQLCGTPIALITLIDSGRQWIKSRHGLDLRETPRAIAFCGHAILANDVFVVPNAMEDERFADNPLVVGAPHVRFYAGAPLTTPEGANIGMLCVLDRSPRELNANERDALARLSRQVVARLEHRLANLRLVEQARLQQLVFSALPAAVISCDPRGAITSVNRGGEDMFGLRAEAVIGSPIAELFGDKSGIAEYLALVVASSKGGNEKSSVLHDLQTREWVFVKADGTRLPVRLSITALSSDGPASAGVLVVAQDVTVERERDLFFSMSPDMFCVAGTDGFLKRVNPAFARALGYPVESLLARSFLDFIHPEDVASTIAVVAKLGRGLNVVDFENRYRRADGTWMSLAWTSAPDHDLIYACARDLTELKRAGEALDVSEEKFSITLNSIGDGVLATDANGRIAMLNAVAERLTGWPSSEAVGRPVGEVFEIVHAETRLPAVIPVDRVLRTGLVCSLATNTILIARDRSERQIADSAAPIKDAEGNVSGVVLVFRDVTAEYATRDALLKHEAYNRSIVESAPDRLEILSLDGMLSYMAPAARRIMQVDDAHPLVDMDWPRLWSGDDEARARDAIATARRGERGQFQGFGATFKGTPKWWDVAISPIYDAKGQPAQLVAVSRDVTDVRRKDEELRESERFIRACLDALKSHIAVLDGEGYILACNKAWREFAKHTGGLAGAFESANYLDICDAAAASGLAPPAEAAKLVREVIKGTRTEYAFEYSYVVDDEELWFVCRATRFSDGSPVRVVLAHEEITESKRALREKESLLQEIHHRVKNNLQIVSSLLGMQLDSAANDVTRGLMQESINRVRSMALIHERLYQSETLARIDFAEYARDLTVFLVRSYKIAGELELVFDLVLTELNIETAVPCGLILNELVSNTLKHAFKDGKPGKLFLALKPTADGGVYVEVRDNGPGLPPGYDMTKATSMGMQLVTSLSRQLKAQLDVETTNGAAFRLKFKELKHAGR